MNRVLRISFASLFLACVWLSFGGSTTALACVGGRPLARSLSVSNYPNPFNPGTTISYTVPSRGAVRITIYNGRGARVRTLFEGDRNTGAYTVQWDGRDANGETVGSGIYFARVDHNGVMRTKKMVLLK